MSIAYVWAWFQVVWRHWKVNLTGGSLMALLFLFESTGKKVPVWLYVGIAVVTLFLSCFLAWKAERVRVIVLTREFVLPELERIRHNTSASTTLIFPSEESEIAFYFEKLNAGGKGVDIALVKDAISLWKKHKPLGPRPSVHRL